MMGEHTYIDHLETGSFGEKGITLDEEFFDLNHHRQVDHFFQGTSSQFISKPCRIHHGTQFLEEETAAYCPEIYRALDGIRYVAECTKREEDSLKVKEDWKYVAMVLDRLFLWIFTVAVLVGSCGIILQAPALYDTRAAIDVQLSEIEAATAKPLSEQHRSNFFV